MRWSQTLIPTQKETPADATIISHQLMVRAGLIRQLTAGAYDFLPLGLRSLRKAMAIVREEMDAIGAAEVLLPALQPVELWQRSGRDVAYGDNLFTFEDRHGRVNVLGPTHEEVVTELVGAYVSSYRQLPLSLYQIQTKFRDEFRPRFGLLRVREFLMKDAYSFHADLPSLDKTYGDFYRAYERIFTRCGIPYVVVEAESGPIGGSASHEFMAACTAGEDTILTSDKGNYAANVEKAATGTRPHTFDGEPTGDLQKVKTPGVSSIDEAGALMKVKPKNMLKVVIFKGAATAAGGPDTVVAVVRGDHQVNASKLATVARATFGIDALGADPAADGLPADLLAATALGYVSPAAVNTLATTVLVVDPDAAQGGFWTAGGDETDHHFKHFNWRRECGAGLDDPARTTVADIRDALGGDPSPVGDGGVLNEAKGIEIGHVFKLGTKYSTALSATFLDAAGQQHPMIMGCYGIGVGRILIAAVESMHDDRGIRWPAAIAPYAVVVTPIKYDGAVRAAADKLYAELIAAGVDVLLDDRDARPGSKFADADLVGFPVRVTVGDRGLNDGKVELKRRSATEPEMIDLAAVTARVREMLTA